MSKSNDQIESAEERSIQRKKIYEKTRLRGNICMIGWLALAVACFTDLFRSLISSRLSGQPIEISGLRIGVLIALGTACILASIGMRMSTKVGLKRMEERWAQEDEELAENDKKDIK